jgi:hypothetical protein
MEDLTLELADSVPAKVEARFTVEEPREAKLFVDGQHIGSEKVGRSFPTGNVLPTHHTSQELGDAIDGGGPIGQLSLTGEQSEKYRHFRNAAEGADECVYEGCHQQAHMLADQGPSCTEHYHELC